MAGNIGNCAGALMTQAARLWPGSLSSGGAASYLVGPQLAADADRG